MTLPNDVARCMGPSCDVAETCHRWLVWQPTSERVKAALWFTPLNPGADCTERIPVEEEPDDAER